MSGHKLDFVYWSFNRTPDFLADAHLSLVEWNPDIFLQPDVMWALLPGLLLQARKLKLIF